MNNFDHAIEATETALNSSGSAATENSRYMESLEAKTNQLKNTFQDLANNVIESDLVKALLDLANKLLGLINTPVGTFVTQIVLLTTAGWGLVKLFQAMNIIGAVINSFKALPMAISAVQAAMQGATTATAAFSAVLNASLPIIAAVSIAVVAATKINDALTVSIEEQREKVDGLKSSYNSLISELDQLKAKDELTDSEKQRLEYLNQQIKATETLLKLENQRLFEKEFEEGESIFGATSAFGMLGLGKETELDKANDYIDTIEEATQEIDALQEQIATLNPEIEAQAEDIIDAKGSMEEWKAEMSDAIVNLGPIVEKLEEYKAAGIDIGPEGQEVIDYYYKITAALEDYGFELKETAEQQDDNTLSLEKMISAFEKTDSIIEFEKVVNNAFEEVDENASLTTATFEDLVGVFPVLANTSNEAVAALFNLDGSLTEAGIEAFATSENLYGTIESIIDLEIQSKSADLSNLRDELRLTSDYAVELAASGSLAQEALEILKTSDYAVELAASGSLAQEALEILNQNKENFDLISQLEQDIIDLQNAKNQLTASYKSYSSGGGRTSSSSSTSKTTSYIEQQSDAFKERNEQLEFYIWLREQQGASEEELIKLNREYQNELHKQAEWFRGQGLDDTSEYIRETIKGWWGLEDTITGLENSIVEKQRAAFDERYAISEDYIEERNNLDDWGADNEIDAWNRVLKWMEEWYKDGLIDYEYYLEKRKIVTEKAAEAEKRIWKENKQSEIDSLEDQIDKYETLFSVVASKAQEEIDALEKEKDYWEDYYDTKIEALQDQNEELDRQIEKEEALEALARSKQKGLMVYKDGRFQYIQDIDEVSEAQANLEKIEREEELRQKIEDLEKSKEATISNIETEIEYWEEIKKEWSSVTDKYKEEQDQLIAEELLGTKLEGKNWETRIGSLTTFVQNYIGLLKKLNKAQEELNLGMDYEEGTTPDSSTSSTIGLGTGSLANTEYNAWAYYPQYGYFPVKVVNGKTQATDLPVGTIIYGDDHAYKITGGSGGEEGYTSEIVGETPSNIWTPGKESSSSVSTGSSGGGGSSSSSSSSGGSYTGSSTTGGGSYVIGSDKGKDFVNNATAGSVMVGGDGSTWTKNEDGSTTINRGDESWTVPAYGNGTLNAKGGISLVGDGGPELRLINPGDAIYPNNISNNLLEWGSLNPGNVFSDLSKNLGTTIAISIDTFSPQLPGVTNGEEFSKYIQTNFWRQVIQYKGTANYKGA